MATVTTPPNRPLDSDAVVPRHTRPVKLWALVGCVIWAFQIFVLLRWVTGPYFHRVPTGPTQPPTEMKVGIITYLTVQWTAFAVLGYRWVIRPLRREHRLSFDGMLFLTWCGWYWLWDPMGNYFSVTYTYNSWVPNMGSWVNSIPGWTSPGSPGAQVPEPWLFTAGAYGIVMVGSSLLGCAIMRRIRARWPQMGTVGLVLWLYGGFVTLATVIELVWMRLGLYTYAAAPDRLPNFFPSHYYKYPVVEGFFFGAMITSVSYLRWSIDDRGESIAERGASTLRARGASSTALRLMAITGFTNVIVFLVFYVPYFVIWSPHPAAFPLDVQARSYLTDGLCGPDTHIACPNPNIPLFREHSLTITPNGKLYVPPGVHLPHDPTTFAQARAEERSHR
jgi:hypothetical protein